MKNGFVLEFPGTSQPCKDDDRIPIGNAEAHLLCRALGLLGVNCHSVLQRSYYGWDFVGRFEGRNYLFVIQFIDPNWSLTVAQTGYTNFFSAQHRMLESLQRLEKLTRDAIESEFNVAAATVGWGFFGLSI